MIRYSDRNQFLVYLDFPSGTHINETTSVTRRLTKWLANSDQNPKIESSIAYIGYGGPRFSWPSLHLTQLTITHL